jgi:hypothetical protein
VGEITDQNIEELLPLVRIWAVSQRLRSNQQCGNTLRKNSHNSIITMSALTLLTETTEAEESRSLKLKTDMLLVEV